MNKLILSSVLILAAGSVFAVDGKISILDADKDGLVSIEEAKVDASLSSAFAELDVNQDGYLSELELTPKID
ncbi:MAG: Ca2+-binding EF-hand superfamily protein [Paraglaciecola sp.]|jgi:Ca2+-binding EF-hand superfamily protein